MQYSLILLKQVIIMFAIICVGIGCYKTKLIAKEGEKYFSSLLLKIVSPIFIFTSYQTDFSAELLKGLAASFSLSVISHILMIVISNILIRKNEKYEYSIERFSLVYTNCGFMGIPLAEIIERAKTDDSFDRTVDTRQVELAREGSCVLGSRLAVWMLHDADLKVYLHAGDEVRAKRIHEREGGDIGQIHAFTRMRDNEDTKRYKKLYNIDNTDCGCVDMQIDTSLYTPEQITDLILDELVRLNLAVKI